MEILKFGVRGIKGFKDFGILGFSDLEIQESIGFRDFGYRDLGICVFRYLDFW